VSDLLRVDDVEVHCVIGVYAEERTTPQALRVSLALALDAGRAAHSGNLEDTVDYARLFGQLRFVLQRGAFRLLETAAEALCAVVLASEPTLAAVTLTLKKPGALGGNGVPALSLTRRRVATALPAARVWTGPDASVDRVLWPTGTAGALPPHAAVLDVRAGRQGTIVEHDGRIAPGDGTRVLLIVATPPAASAPLSVFS
jgi:dihydroneopterin aldolase